MIRLTEPSELHSNAKIIVIKIGSHRFVEP